MALKLPKIVPQKDALKMLKAINLECATGVRNYAIIIMMYRAGLRVSEICNLALSDANFETGLIYIQQGKGKKDRYTILDDDITETLKRWLAISPESNYLFCTLEGGQLNVRYIREVCYRLSTKAGVFIQDGQEKKKVSPHKLRHSCFTELLRDGTCNIREVQELAGHASLNTTMIYTHVVMDELQEKIRKRKGIAQ